MTYRLSVTLLLKNKGVYRNYSWGKYRYLGNLSNIIKLFSQSKTTELVFIDLDRSLTDVSFQKELFNSILQANFPVTCFIDKKDISSLSKKFISNGVERLGINISNNLDIEDIGLYVKSFGSSSASSLINISKKDIIKVNNSFEFNENLKNKINILYEKGIREIIFQDKISIGQKKRTIIICFRINNKFI